MRNRIIFTAFFGLVSCFLANAIPANAFDSTPPSLGTVTVSQSSLPETGGTVVVTVQVNAAAYGLDQAPLFVFQQDGYSKNFSCTRPMGLRMALMSGDEKNGTYRCETDFAAPLKPGLYKLMFFPLTDKGGNNSGGFINTSFSVSVGVPAPLSTASSTPTTSPTKPPQATVTQEAYDAIVSKNSELVSQIASLQAKMTSLIAIQNKFTKICSSKPKPKGC